MSHFRIQIMRQHTKIASEMSSGPRLMASKHEKSRNLPSQKPVLQLCSALSISMHTPFWENLAGYPMSVIPARHQDLTDGS